jgi:cell division protein FtsQ
VNRYQNRRVRSPQIPGKTKAGLLKLGHLLRFRSRNQELQANRRVVPRAWREWYVGGFALVAAVGAFELSRLVLAPYAAHHPYFAVREIIVNADSGFAEQEVQTWSGLTLGMNLWEVDSPQVEARLRAYSWIQSAEVKREFPQRVYVTLKGRRAVAIILGEPLTYLDDSGVCFLGQGNAVDPHLPYVTGLANVPLETPTARTALSDVLHLLSLTRLWQEPLSEIHWDQRQGYTLFLARRRISIRLGWETELGKIAQLGEVLQTWPVDGPAALLDARFTNQVVVRPYLDDRPPSQQDFTGSL